MKHVIYMMVLAIALCGTSCDPNKNKPTTPAAKPNWQVLENSDYSESMTITCVPPQGETAHSDDEVAVFWTDSCRGVAGQVNGIFYLVVRGPQRQQEMILRYYSATKKSIRQMAATYYPETNVGSTDEPLQMSF